MFHPYVRVASPSLRMGLCMLVPDPNWGRECVPLEKKTLMGGIGNFLGHRMQAILEMSQITQAGWHLTPIAITSEQTGVAVGAHLVLTWVGCSTGPAINPRDTRSKPVTTPACSSVPRGLRVGCYPPGIRVGASTSS